MSRPRLFQPLSVGNLALVNRTVIAPMCQYAAGNGCRTAWHPIHLGHLALSGAALLPWHGAAQISPTAEAVVRRSRLHRRHSQGR
jgi:2,4-dienoyl-CoA reductase-like NADH-dependent reductase (Old Yellow Enzyme family)